MKKKYITYGFLEWNESPWRVCIEQCGIRKLKGNVVKTARRYLPHRITKEPLRIYKIEVTEVGRVG